MSILLWAFCVIYTLGTLAGVLQALRGGNYVIPARYVEEPERLHPMARLQGPKQKMFSATISLAMALLCLYAVWNWV